MTSQKRRRNTDEEKEEDDGEEEQFLDRDSEELGMQFSLVLRVWGHLTLGLTEAGILGSVGGVNF